jgi:hypothetical protein
MRNMCKKTTVILFALVFICGIAISGFTQRTDSKVERRTESKTVTGTVDSVSSADPVKGTKSEIIITDEKNKKFSFLITSTTTMYGAKSVPIILEKIKKGDKVKVKYAITKEGVEKAVSVRIAP